MRRETGGGADYWMIRATGLFCLRHDKGAIQG
jgi:hypothetical protein